MEKTRLEILKENILKKRDEDHNREGNNHGGDFYPFWVMDFNTRVEVRFLLDKNEENPNGWFVEKKEHRLSINGKNEKIPCMRMFGEKCPICELSEHYYNASKEYAKGTSEHDDLTAKGKYYYRDLRRLTTAFIRIDPIKDSKNNDDSTNTIKVIQFNWSLFNMIQSKVNAMIIDYEQDPFSIHNGYDFFITKTSKSIDGKLVGDYTTSDFSRQSSAISDDIFDKSTLLDLSSFLPSNPGSDKISRMLESHLSGLDYSDDANNDIGDGGLVADDDVDVLTARLKKARAAMPDRTIEPPTSTIDVPREVTTSIDSKEGTPPLEDTKVNIKEDLQKAILDDKDDDEALLNAILNRH